MRGTGNTEIDRSTFQNILCPIANSCVCVNQHATVPIFDMSVERYHLYGRR